VLDGVEARRVEGHQPDVGGEDRPRRRREVLQPRPDRQHDVRGGREDVRRRRAGDAQRPGVQGVRVRNQRPARGGFHDRDPVPLGEVQRPSRGPRIPDTAAEHQQGTAGRTQDPGRLGDRTAVRARARRPVRHRLEQRVREVVGLGLDVLRQREGHRPGLGRVRQHPRDLRQRREQLLGPADPVEVAGDRAERVVHRRGRVAERLDLLQHRIRRPVGERVARQQQHRQPVRVGDAGRGDHVERARSDRRRHDTDLPPVRGLRVPDRGERHALLGVPAPDREVPAVLLQGGAEAEDVAVPEDREDAREERDFRAVQGLRALREDPADQRLRRRQLHCTRPS
jgi:hypothetical protein